jgi:SagB-type dehydrogenase family enzyme
MKEKNTGIGDQYQQETKYTRNSMSGGFLDWDNMPPRFKEYPDARQVITLPAPVTDGGTGLWQILHRRRSERDFSSSPLALKDLSQLVFATQGSTAKAGGYVLRTAPSAGALYPVETYLAVNRVESLAPGLYHFNVLQYCLELLQEGDVSPALCRAGLGQTMVMECAAVFIWTAIVARSKWKYRERAYRYIYMDAGHIGENLYLAAAALKLGCCTIGAFYDEEVNAVVGIDGVSETAVYMGVVGRCDSSGKPRP